MNTYMPIYININNECILRFKFVYEKKKIIDVRSQLKKICVGEYIFTGFHSYSFVYDYIRYKLFKKRQKHSN